MTYPWTLNYSNWKQIIQFTAIMMIKIFRAVILYSSFFLAKKTKLNWCCRSVTRSCLTLCDPMNYSTPGFPVLHYLLELAQTHFHWVGDAIQLSHPLSSPSLPAFNLSQWALCIWWPKYWSFNFSISPSNDYAGLFSFRIDFFDLLAVPGTLKSLL